MRDARLSLLDKFALTNARRADERRAEAGERLRQRAAGLVELVTAPGAAAAELSVLKNALRDPGVLEALQDVAPPSAREALQRALTACGITTHAPAAPAGKVAAAAQATTRTAAAPSKAAASDIAEAARREYERNPALAAEFGAVDAFVAYRRAEAGGQIKIFR